MAIIDLLYDKFRGEEELFSGVSFDSFCYCFVVLVEVCGIDVAVAEL